MTPGDRGRVGRRGAAAGGALPRRARATVRTESIAAGGEGVGRLEDGRAVFVHRTAPGETVQLELLHQQRRWARGRLLRVTAAAPERRQPLCRYYAECGGCTLEHLSYDLQLQAKARIVADALSRIGRIPTDPPEIVGSPRQTRYRNRVSFALRRLAGERVVAGFHALHEADRIVDIGPDCQLPEEPIAAVWEGLRSGWGTGARRLPSGEQLRLTLRATAAGQVSLLVDGGFASGRPAELLAAVPGLVSIWHRPPESELVWLAGLERLTESWGDERLELGGAAFLQVNREVARLLEQHVLDLLGEVAGQRLVDAYCGVGLHARRLARNGAVVVGIERDAAAVTAAERGAPPRARFEIGPVEARLPKHLPADAVILNPPRAGLDQVVVAALLAQPSARLVYVSCNPATLARDLGRLAPQYRLRGLRCFDMFPQTAHVETVALIT
jgi:23S rRNA (uracil1939-C5)-methyltransferase